MASIVNRKGKYNISENLMIFSRDFNDPLDESILADMKKCEHIIFNCEFQKPVDNLPNNIVKITFQFFDLYSRNMTKPSNLKMDNLSHSLKELFIYGEYYGFLDMLPSGLEKLYIEKFTGSNLNNLPNNLKYLKVEYYLAKEQITCFPQNLKELCFTKFFNQDISHLPDSVEILELGISFERRITKLPDMLKYLKIGDVYHNDNNNFSSSLEDVIPESIISISIFTHSVEEFIKNNKKLDDDIWNKIELNKDYLY